MTLALQFLGAAGTVTGSSFLVQVDGRRYLVDCGLFQGGRSLRALNREPFASPLEQLQAILLTHAHLDHTVLLPLLVRQGSRGPVYATEATCALFAGHRGVKALVHRIDDYRQTIDSRE